MKITLAYSEQPEHEYDLVAALHDKTNPLNIFTIDVVIDPSSSVAETVTTKLLDNQKWQLKTNHRHSQSFTTKPTINLESVKVNKVEMSVKQALENWFYARSRWIMSRDLQSPDAKVQNLIKVVRTSDGLDYSQTENINYLETTTVKYETAQSFQ